MAHDGDRAPAMRADVVPAAAAGQAHLGVVIIADHGAVQVAVGIDLRAAQEAELDKAALGCLDDLAQTGCGERAVEGALPADRHRQLVQDGSHAAKLEEGDQVGGVHLLR